MAHTRKRIRKLSTAVFRGSRTEYNFDVYPITTAITDNAVVFIFSRRQVDRFGRAHHAVSCAGETVSIVSEIKKHKRARCIKGNEANVVCILRKPDRTERIDVLDDITSVRAFSCVRGKFKPTIKAKLSVVKDAKTAKILPFKPLKKAGRAGISASNGEPAAAVRKTGKASAVKLKSGNQKAQRTVARSVKKERTTEGGKRVQGGVDSDSGQHRLSKPKKPVARSTKARVARHSRSRERRAA